MAQWNNRSLKKLKEDPSPYPWEDWRFPADGFRLEAGSTRYSFDFFNGGILFASNARFSLTTNTNNERLSALLQTSHDWLEGDNVRPHLHWLQDTAGPVNWLLGYRKYDNGNTSSIVTNYNNHTLLTGSEAFDYTSGTIVQITEFGEIDMSDMTASDMMHFVIWSDTANTSGEFSGSDANDRLLLEFDVHFRRRGSYVITDGKERSQTGVYLGTYHEFQHLGEEYVPKYGVDK